MRKGSADLLQGLVNNNLVAGGGNADVSQVLGGVTVSWLAQVFHMDPKTVKFRLKDAPALHHRKAGSIYDIKVAAQYLVKPVFDAGEYIKTMKPNELPVHLQDQYWSALSKRQKWEENAGHLWRTEKVVKVFGTVFQLIKGSMQLWGENIQRGTGLNKEQKAALRAQVDGLQAQIYKELIELPRKGMTPPMLAEVDELTNNEAPVSPKQGKFHDLI